MPEINNKYPDLKIGDKIKLINSIYDDGEDHHQPGYLAYRGDELIVRNIFKTCIYVSHEGVVKNSFRIYNGEFTK